MECALELELVEGDSEKVTRCFTIADTPQRLLCTNHSLECLFFTCSFYTIRVPHIFSGSGGLICHNPTDPWEMLFKYVSHDIIQLFQFQF